MSKQIRALARYSRFGARGALLAGAGDEKQPVPARESLARHLGLFRDERSDGM